MDIYVFKEIEPRLTTTAQVATVSLRKYWFFLPLALVLYAYLNLFRDAIIDDAFITLNYVRTLTDHGVWGFYPNHLSNTATSPLNVILLSLVTLISSSPLDAIFWLTLIVWMILALLLFEIGELLALPWFALVAFIALVANPLLMSTLGLETILFSTLLVAALYFFLASRFNACAIAAGLLTITRPDGVLFFAIIMLFLPGWRVRSRTLAIYSLSLFPWYIFSWVYLGNFIPDTFLLKLRQSGAWGSASFGSGVLKFYLPRYPIEVYLSAIMLLPAFLSFSKSVRELGPLVWILWLYGLLHFGVYSSMGVLPYHWYYGPEVIVLCLLGALAIAVFYRSARAGWQQLAATTFLVVALLIPSAGTGFLIKRAGAPLAEPFIGTNHATHEQYRAIGEYIAEHHPRKVILRQRVEPGTIAYYCNCYLLDSDFNMRDWLAEDIKLYRSGASLADRIMQINHLFFEPSAAYPPSSALLKRVAMTDSLKDETPHWIIFNSWSSKPRKIALEVN